MPIALLTSRTPSHGTCTAGCSGLVQSDTTARRHGLVEAALAILVGVLMASCGGGHVEPSMAPWEGPRATQGTTVAGDAMQPMRRRTLAAPSPDPIKETSALFNWAEMAYPDLFPGPQVNQSLAPYVYRHYPQTGHYLGVANGEVFVLGPATGGLIVGVGRVADFACNVQPRDCLPGPGELPVRKANLSVNSIGTMVASADGRVAAWGVTAPEGSIALPQQRAQILGGLHSVVSVRAGTPLHFVIQADGTLLAWGLDSYSKTRGGSADSRSISVTRPSSIPGLPKVADAMECDGVLYALARDGRVWSSPGPQRGDSAPPAVIEGLSGVVALGHGGTGCTPLFIHADGTVHAAQTFKREMAARGEAPVQIGRVDGLVDVASVEDLRVVVTRSGEVQLLDQLSPRTAAGNDWFAVTRVVSGLPAARQAVIWRNRTNEELAVLAEDGKVWRVQHWSNKAPTEVFQSGEHFAELAAASSHIAGLMTDGTVWSWGDNGVGQHGVGQGAVTVRRGTAVQASFVNSNACSADVRSCATAQLDLPVAHRPLSLGMYGFGLGLTTDGGLFAWGDIRTYLNASHLQAMPGSYLSTVKGLPPLAAVIGWGQLLIAQNGELWAWGSHTGELDGVLSGALKALPGPSRIPYYQDVVDAHLGCGRILALRRDGNLWRTPDLDTANTVTPRPPVPLVGFDGVVAIGSGNPDGDRGCEAHVIRADGSVWLVRQGASVVDLVPGLPPIAEVSCTYLGTEACLARTRHGEVWGWGLNQRGTVGDGTLKARLTPVRAPALASVDQVTAAEGGRALVRGALLGWGRVRTTTWDGRQQIDTDSLTPLTLADEGAGIVTMSDDARALVQRDGSLWLWGLAADGRNCGGVLPDCRSYRRADGVSVRTRP